MMFKAVDAESAKLFGWTGYRTVLALLITVGGLVFIPAPHAEAMPCLHRGWTHVVQHANGNVDADSRYHVLHGEAPTCDTDGGPSGAEDTWERRQADIDRDRHGW